MDTRDTVNPLDLENMVYVKMMEYVVTGESFTAYNITRALREDNADKEIVHAEVKALIHQMNTDAEIVGYEAAPDTSLPGDPLRFSPIVVTN